MFYRCFMFILPKIFNDSGRSVILTSTTPILTKFAGLVELWLWMNDLKLLQLSDPSSDVAMATNFVGQLQAQSTELSSHVIR